MGSTVVKYFVVLPDGQRFGPADISLLNQWIAEGRILPNTVLEQEATGQRFMASTVPGLTLASTGPYAPPSSGGAGPTSFAGYYRGPVAQPYGGQNDLTMAWVFSSLGMMFCLGGLACGPCAAIGIVFPILGVVYSGRALQAGNPGAQPAKIFSWVTLGLYIAGLVLMFALFGMISVAG